MDHVSHILTTKRPTEQWDSYTLNFYTGNQKRMGQNQERTNPHISDLKPDSINMKDPYAYGPWFRRHRPPVACGRRKAEDRDRGQSPGRAEGLQGVASADGLCRVLTH